MRVNVVAASTFLAQTKGGEWLSYGLDLAETRFSPLDTSAEEK